MSLTADATSTGFSEAMLDKIVNYIPSVLFAVLFFIIGNLISKVIIKILVKGLEKSRLDKTVHGFLRSMVRVALYAITLIISLTILKIPMTTIVAVVGAAGLAVGLALQNSLSNIAGGFILLFAKPFKVGSYIEVNGLSGTVQEITILSTKISTLDNKTIIIPNGVMSSATIVNYTQETNRRVDLSFGISYDNDFRQAISVINKIIADNKLIMTTPEPTVRLNELAESSMNIVTRVWVKSEDYWTVYYDLLEQVKLAFDENGISVPYNQLDVHVVNNN